MTGVSSLCVCSWNRSRSTGCGDCFLCIFMHPVSKHAFQGEASAPGDAGARPPLLAGQRDKHNHILHLQRAREGHKGVFDRQENWRRRFWNRVCGKIARRNTHCGQGYKRKEHARDWTGGKRGDRPLVRKPHKLGPTLGLLPRVEGPVASLRVCRKWNPNGALAAGTRALSGLGPEDTDRYWNRGGVGVSSFRDQPADLSPWR